MKTEAELSNNSSWTIEIAATGEATLLAQGSNTRNKMRFNPNNGNPIFSCYASDSSTGSAVSIYFHEDLRAESEIAWDETIGRMLQVGLQRTADRIVFGRKSVAGKGDIHAVTPSFKIKVIKLPHLPRAPNTD